MRLRKSMSRIARTLSWSSTYSRIDSSGSIEIDQRFSSISTSWKPTSGGRRSARRSPGRTPRRRSCACLPRRAGRGPPRQWSFRRRPCRCVLGSTPNATSISTVSLLRLSTVTHSTNMNQRFLRLALSPGSGGLNVTAPSAAETAPPGDYMLFLLNSTWRAVGPINRAGSVWGCRLLRRRNRPPPRSRAVASTLPGATMRRTSLESNER